MLSADFMNLKADIEMINSSTAEWLHVDMMDGVFVPNISIGFPILESLQKCCKKALDVHYMVVNPEKYIDLTARSGAKVMTVHQEACVHLHRVVHQIKESGMLAGVALNPGTSLHVLEEVLCDVDVVLLMSVNPGFGGQKFIDSSIKKVSRLKQMIKEQNSNALIEVDGGVNKETAPLLINAGADVLVSGSYVFNSSDPLKTIAELG